MKRGSRTPRKDSHLNEARLQLQSIEMYLNENLLLDHYNSWLKCKVDGKRTPFIMPKFWRKIFS